MGDIHFSLFPLNTIKVCNYIVVIMYAVYLFYPGHPLFQGVSYVLLTCPIILIPVLSWGGPSLSSWPISNQRSYSTVG